MITRILLAADDSPAGLAATRTAVALATSEDAVLRAVYVLGDGDLTRALAALHRGDVRARRDLGASAVLDHVAGLARRAGVIADTVSLSGEPARCILDEAQAWGAELIVLGRSDRPTDQYRPGHPYIGRNVRHVLEFAEQPVLVVPAGPPLTTEGHAGEVV